MGEMELKGRVVLGTMAEQQAAGDRTIINPDMVPPAETLPLTINFDHSRIVGRARTYHEGGRLLADLELTDEAASLLENVEISGGLGWAGMPDLKSISLGIVPK